MPVSPVPNEFCTNCGIRLSGPFCPQCGQRDRELNPPLRHLVAEATDELLNVDGKIFRSVWTLLAKPGVLTRDFFEGRRARWVSPIRLYLVGSVLYFGYASLYDDSGNMQTTGRLMFVLLPAFAWLVSLVSAVRLNFPQHMYFALHVHTAWFMAWAGSPHTCLLARVCRHGVPACVQRGSVALGVENGNCRYAVCRRACCCARCDSVAHGAMAIRSEVMACVDR